MAPNRIVALATPLAAPLAGAFAAWLSQQIPGAELQREAIEETFIVVTGLVLALALQFIHNRFKWDVAAEQTAAAAELPSLFDNAEPELVADDDEDVLADEELLADDDLLVDEDLFDVEELLDDGVLLEGADEQQLRESDAASDSPVR